MSSYKLFFNLQQTRSWAADAWKLFEPRARRATWHTYDKSRVAARHLYVHRRTRSLVRLINWTYVKLSINLAKSYAEIEKNAKLAAHVTHAHKFSDTKRCHIRLDFVTRFN